MRRHRTAKSVFFALKADALYPPGPSFPRQWRELEISSTRIGASDPLVRRRLLVGSSGMLMCLGASGEIRPWPKWPSEPRRKARDIRFGWRER